MGKCTVCPRGGARTVFCDLWKDVRYLPAVLPAAVLMSILQGGDGWVLRPGWRQSWFGGKLTESKGAEVLEQWQGRPGSYCVPAVNPCMALNKMLKEHSPQKRGPARQQCNQGDANSGDGSRRWNLQRISSGHVGTVGEHPRFWGGLMGGQRVRRYQVPPARSQGWSRQWVGCEVDTWGQEHQTAGVPIFQMLVTTIINFVNDGNIDGIIA